MATHYSGPVTQNGVRRNIAAEEELILAETQYAPELRKDAVLVLQKIYRLFENMVLENEQDEHSGPYKRKKRKDEHCQAPLPVELSKEQIIRLGLALRQLRLVVRKRLEGALQNRLRVRLFHEGQRGVHPEVYSPLRN